MNRVVFLSWSPCVQLLPSGIFQLLSHIGAFSGKKISEMFTLQSTGPIFPFCILFMPFVYPYENLSIWFFNFALSYWENSHQLCLKACRFTGVQGTPSQAPSEWGHFPELVPLVLTLFFFYYIVCTSDEDVFSDLFLNVTLSFSDI